jgi:hypothetical protein
MRFDRGHVSIVPGGVKVFWALSVLTLFGCDRKYPTNFIQSSVMASFDPRDSDMLSTNSTISSYSWVLRCSLLSVGAAARGGVNSLTQRIFVINDNPRGFNKFVDGMVAHDD